MINNRPGVSRNQLLKEAEQIFEKPAYTLNEISHILGIPSDRVISNYLALNDGTFFSPLPDGFKLLERAPGVSVEEIVEKTGAPLIVEGDIPEMKL